MCLMSKVFWKVSYVKSVLKCLMSQVFWKVSCAKNCFVKCLMPKSVLKSVSSLKWFWRCLSTWNIFKGVLQAHMSPEVSAGGTLDLEAKTCSHISSIKRLLKGSPVVQLSLAHVWEVIKWLNLLKWCLIQFNISIYSYIVF